MTETSKLWTTGGAGDGSATYTRVDWSTIAKIFASCQGFEGVGASFLNGLAPSTTGANNARIASGGALVDGKPYQSDANVDTNIPSSIGGGNTRIDRIVLRADWTAQTVRVTRIAGTDAASPSVPAITQTPGTLYDIKLCQALVNTSGTVTITDERTFAQLSNLNQIAAALITAAKIAAATITAVQIANNAIGTTQMALASVDDTIVGNRVPKLTNRQGNSATDWVGAGTTNYVPALVKQQAGAAQWSGSAAASGFIAVTFPAAFSTVPVALVTAMTGNAGAADILIFIGLAANILTINWKSASGTNYTSVLFTWLAIGTP